MKAESQTARFQLSAFGFQLSTANRNQMTYPVVPAEAGIRVVQGVDSRFRGNDEPGRRTVEAKHTQP